MPTCPSESFTKTDGKIMRGLNGSSKMLFPMARGSFGNVLKLATESNHSWNVHCLMTDKKDEIFSLQEQTLITGYQLLHQFSYWGPHFEISFDLLLDKIDKSSLYVNILIFTQSNKQCCTL